MSVLARADDPWAAMSVSLEADQADLSLETTPLNSPDKQDRGRSGGRSSSSPSPIIMRRNVATGAEVMAAEQAEHDAGMQGADLRRSRMAYILLSLLTATPGLDVLVLLDIFSSIEATATEVAFGEDTRSVARAAQIVVTIFTLILSAYSISVQRRWMVSLPRHAAAAATSFALLPEYTTIALVIDVGKLAYPVGARVAMVALMMLLRVATIAVLLRLAYLAGVRKGLVAQRKMPEMLRTLVSLEGVEARGMGDLAPQAERPLSVDLLEKLIVFLTPRRFGERPKEGAGLARNSILPLTVFTLLLTGLAGFTEYERLRTSQEPSIPASVA